MADTIKIQLDPPLDNFWARRTHIFGPGEKISGKVIFSPTSAEKVDGIFIEFKGKVKTRHGRDDQDRQYERQLFFVRESLFKGPYKLRAAAYEYPFSLTFPETFFFAYSEFADEGRWKGYAGAARTNKMPCPPSCTSIGDHGGGEVEIYYHLTARIPRTFTDWESKVSIEFAPWRKELEVAEMRKVARNIEGGSGERDLEYRLNDEGVPRQLTKTEAFKRAFKSNLQTKRVSFSLQAVAPTQIVLRQPYQVEIMMTSTNAAELGIVPDFKLKNFELKLKEKTEYRTGRLVSPDNGYLERALTLASSWGLDITMPLNVLLKFDNMFPVQARLAAPSFFSFAVRRTYGLELKVVVECLGTSLKFKVPWSVTLYPARMEPGLEQAMRSIEAGTARLNTGATEQVVDLPAYQPPEEEEVVLPGYETRASGNASGL